MKWNYSRQLTLTCILVLLGNILSTLLRHWIFRNISFLLCGTIWLLHPLMAGNRESAGKERNLIRFIGGGR